MIYQKSILEGSGRHSDPKVAPGSDLTPKTRFVRSPMGPQEDPMGPTKSMFSINMILGSGRYPNGFLAKF